MSTDGFLFPNDVVNERGLLLRKGFPETFDVAALDAFVVAARSAVGPLTATVYDHSTFDIVAGERRSIGRPEVILLDGVLLPDALAVSIYLDADVADIERSFVDRFVAEAVPDGVGSEPETERPRPKKMTRAPGGRALVGRST